MIELTGDLFATPGLDAICVPTNGRIRKHGSAVMGAGVALQAAQRWPGIDRRLGALLKEFGSHVYRIAGPHDTLDLGQPVPFAELDVFSLPTKHDWRAPAEIGLIERSLGELREATAQHQRVGLPRPGCGNGGLLWKAVRPLVERILPEPRYIVIERNP